MAWFRCNSSNAPSIRAIYTINESQGGSWINTNIQANQYDKFLFVFNSVADDYLMRQVLTSNIAVYTGGQDVYTTIFNSQTIGQSFNVRIYNGFLYVSFSGIGQNTHKVSVCVPSIDIDT